MHAVPRPILLPHLCLRRVKDKFKPIVLPTLGLPIFQAVSEYKKISYNLTMRNCFGIIASLFISFYSQAKDCSLSELYGNCENLRTDGLSWRNSDGTQTPNLFKILGATDADFNNPEFNKQLQVVAAPPINTLANQQQLESTLKHIKEVYIEETLQGRDESDPNLDSATKSIIIRLRSLEIMKASEQEAGCNGRNVANAFYRGTDHKMVVCSGLAKSSELMLLFVVAHEVGHSIDSCRLSTPFIQIQPDVEKKTCDKKELSVSERPEMLAPYAGKYMAADEFSIHADVLEKCGFAKVISPPQKSLGKNGLAGTVNCVLQRNSKSAMPVQTFNDFTAGVKSNLRVSNPQISDSNIEMVFQKALPALTTEYEKYVGMMAQINQKIMACRNSFAANDSGMNTSEERSADTLAAKVVKNFVKGKELATDQKRSLIEFQAQIACGYKLTNGTKFNNPLYPVGEERMNILLQEPEIQRALGCGYRGEKICSSDQINTSQNQFGTANPPSTDENRGVR